MRISRIELRRFAIPFRNAFVHAAASRRQSDVILVCVHFDGGPIGFGEVQARPYVTGESNDDIWSSAAPALATGLVGRELEGFAEVQDVLGGAGAYARAPACTGGFDIAITDALDVAGSLDWSEVFGPPRVRPIERSSTIGSDISLVDIRRRGRFARLSGCAVVKLKVTGPDDVARCRELRGAVGGEVRIRLDANGRLGLDDALHLLRATTDLEIESIEEPLDPSVPGYIDALRHLHQETGVPIVADESACTVEDVERFAGTGAFQVVNVRAGKCGGVTGTARFLHRAVDLGFAIVSGTMVGESAVLLRVSEALLHHCDELGYVEGLGQDTSLLVSPVVRADSSAPNRHFSWTRDGYERYLVSQVAYP